MIVSILLAFTVHHWKCAVSR